MHKLDPGLTAMQRPGAALVAWITTIIYVLFGDLKGQARVCRDTPTNLTTACSHSKARWTDCVQRSDALAHGGAE